MYCIVHVLHLGCGPKRQTLPFVSMTTRMETLGRPTHKARSPQHKPRRQKLQTHAAPRIHLPIECILWSTSRYSTSRPKYIRAIGPLPLPLFAWPCSDFRLQGPANRAMIRTVEQPAFPSSKRNWNPMGFVEWSGYKDIRLVYRLPSLNCVDIERSHAILHYIEDTPNSEIIRKDWTITGGHTMSQQAILSKSRKEKLR